MGLPITHRDVQLRIQNFDLSSEQIDQINLDLIPRAVSDLEGWLGRRITVETIVGESHVIAPLDPNPQIRVRSTPLISIQDIRIDGWTLPSSILEISIPVSLYDQYEWGIKLPYLPMWPRLRHVEVDYTGGLQESARYYDSIRGALLDRVEREFTGRAARVALNATGVRLVDVEGYRVQFESIREEGSILSNGFYGSELSGLTRFKRRLVR